MMKASRRTFFKSSVALAAALIAWRQGVLVPAQNQAKKIEVFHFLNREDVELLSVVLPCLLPFRNWDVATLAHFCARFDGTISHMEVEVQKEIRQLFDIFYIAPMRWWLKLPAIKKITPAQMEQALEKLQSSRLPDFRAIALGLNELVCGVYYSDPAVESELDYAPPTELL